MADSARFFKNFNGPYAGSISAEDITSRQDAIRYAPFIDDDGRPMIYVSKGFRETSDRPVRPHFRRHEASTTPPPPGQSGGESAEHLQAKEMLRCALERRLVAGQSLTWAFKDRRLHFVFRGQLLTGVTTVVKEHPIHLPDGTIIRPDVALIGQDYAGQETVFWIIEVVREHDVDSEKFFKIHRLGIPALVIDIEELELSEITEAWAETAVAETCASSPDGRRKNFIHYPDTLKVICNDWSRQRAEEHADQETASRHKFVVFGVDERVVSLCELLKAERDRLRVPQTDITAPRNTNTQTEKEFANARALVPASWIDLAGERYLRIITPRPRTPGPELDFHRALARLVANDGRVIMSYDPKGFEGSKRMAEIVHVLDPIRVKENMGQNKPITYFPLVPRILVYPYLLHDHRT